MVEDVRQHLLQSPVKSLGELAPGVLEYKSIAASFL